MEMLDEAGQGEARRGKARRGKVRRGEDRLGGVRQDEAGRGGVRRGGARRGGPPPFRPHRNQEAEEWLAVTPNGHQRRGARLALHGAFVAVGRGRDLALLSLDAPLPIGPELRPLCLPYRDHRRPLGSRCWATMAANGGCRRP